MKFEVNDKVVVKHSHEDGVVREIINDKMVLVEVRGVKFPAYTDQLDYPYFKMFTQKETPAPRKPVKQFIDNIKKERPAPKYKVAEGVWLLFFPVFAKDVFDDEVVDSLKVYVVNQTDNGLKFNFWLRSKGGTDFELQNEVFALTDFYLMDVDFETLNDGLSFDFEFSLINSQPSLADYFEASYKPKAKQVFKQIEHIHQHGDAFFSYQLFAKYPDRPKTVEPEPESPWNLNKLTDAGFKVMNNKRVFSEPAPPSVLDLHIEKLTEDYIGMGSHEKLTFQLNAFEKWLNKVELHYMKHVFVIHGIGKGTLKDEIHNMLKQRSSVKSFVQQYHPWYGHGATEIFLK